MFSSKLSPQTITYWLVGLILTSRFLSSHAFEIGTVCILLFWVCMFTLLPDYIEGFEIKIFPHSDFSLTTKLLIILVLIVSLVVLIFRKTIFAADTSTDITILRRSLYLIHPVICFLWLPFLKSKHSREFYFVIAMLTVSMAMVIVLPKFLHAIEFGQYLNSRTCIVSGFLLSLFIEAKVSVIGNIFYTKTFSLEVSPVCGSPPQILLSLYVILVCYFTCKITSRLKLILISLCVVGIAFLSNSLRIMILGYLLEVNKTSLFDFWHNGLGSLIFSFFTITCTCAIYYFAWSREIRLEESKEIIK